MNGSRHRPGARLGSLVWLAVAAATLIAAPIAHATKGEPNCTAEQGQAFIDAGRYDRAIKEFGCVIAANPIEAEGYRGRAEAELLLGRYSDALRDYTRITAFILPTEPGAIAAIHAGYAARLGVNPGDVPALTGASFARWYDFDYGQATQVLNDLLGLRPDDAYGNLFRGSSRLLLGGPKQLGAADLERAIELAPNSADVRSIVADAYTYGLADPARALAEATLALGWGLDTPRVHAILGAARNAFGDIGPAAGHIARHIDLVTAEQVTTDPLPAGASAALELVPGRTYQVPIAVTAGATISITTGSKDFWDSIAVLLGPDEMPVVGSDDDSGYHAAFDWVAPATGTYWLQVTSFESISTGTLAVKRS